VAWKFQPTHIRKPFGQNCVPIIYKTDSNMKQILISIFILINSHCFSQNPIYEIDFVKKNEIIDVLPIFTKTEKLLSLLILQRDSFKTILFDSLHNVENTYSIKIKNSQIFEKLVDISSFNSQVYVVYKNKSIYSSRYGFFAIDYDEEILLEKELNFNIDREEFVASHAFGNNFYIVTIKLNTSNLFLYRFNNRGELLSKILLDLSNFNENVDLYTLVKNKNPGNYSVDIININEGNRTILNTYSSKNKSYVKDGKLQLLIGNLNQKTVLYTIDLPTATFKIKDFFPPELSCNPHSYYKNNSLLMDSLLFQFYACSKELSLTISSIATSKKYATYKSSPKAMNEFQQGIKVTYEFGDLHLENIDPKDFRTFLKGFMESDLFISLNDYEHDSYTFSIGILDKETIIIPIFLFPSYVFMFSYQHTVPISIYYTINKQDLTIQRYNNMDFHNIKETLSNRDIENQFALYDYIFDYNKKDKKLQLLHKE